MHHWCAQVNRKWAIPKDVEASTQVRDLLSLILDPDPETRLTVEALQQHPWFVTNLPAEAAGMNKSFLQKEGRPRGKGRQSPEDIHALMDQVRGRGVRGGEA